MCSNGSVLVRVTKDLLANRNNKLTYRSISQAIEVDEAWIKSFASNKDIKSPNIVYLEKLFNFLADKQLLDLIS